MKTISSHFETFLFPFLERIILLDEDDFNVLSCASSKVWDVLSSPQPCSLSSVSDESESVSGACVRLTEKGWDERLNQRGLLLHPD